MGCLVYLIPQWYARVFVVVVVVAATAGMPVHIRGGRIVHVLLLTYECSRVCTVCYPSIYSSLSLSPSSVCMYVCMCEREREREREVTERVGMCAAVTLFYKVHVQGIRRLDSSL